MSDRVPFDDFADVYAAWCASAAPVTDANLRFYADEYARRGTTVVELGVGDGRVAIEAARAGLDVVGVDHSTEMLARCRARFEAEGLLAHLELQRADFREFELDQPAELVSIPFHTIGALTDLDSKRACFARVHASLAPGGRLVFDHFVCDTEYGARQNGLAQLRYEFEDEATGAPVLLWTTTRYDFEHKTLRIVAWTDRLDERGVVVERRYRRVDFSWIDPQDTRTLLEEAGFEVEHLYGSFDREPFDADSRHQIWVARKPS